MPTVDEFKQLLKTVALEDIVRTLVFQGPCFAFHHDPAIIDRLTNHLSVSLNVLETNITVIGSGKVGFSLAPDEFPSPFSDESDIDILIVDEKLFDSVWLCLLEWHYYLMPRTLNGDEAKWIANKQKTIYYGALDVDDLVLAQGMRSIYLLKPMRDLRNRWFNAFKNLSTVKGLEKRDVNGWLYRTWDHAMKYHADGLRQIKEKYK